MSKLKDDKRCSLDDQFFGLATVGERGQVVIPAEARKSLDIQPGDKLLVMGHPFGGGLVLAKLDSMREFLSTFLDGLAGVEKALGEEALTERPGHKGVGDGGG